MVTRSHGILRPRRPFQLICLIGCSETLPCGLVVAELFFNARQGEQGIGLAVIGQPPESLEAGVVIRERLGRFEQSSQGHAVLASQRRGTFKPRDGARPVPQLLGEMPAVEMRRVVVGIGF